MKKARKSYRGVHDENKCCSKCMMCRNYSSVDEQTTLVPERLTLKQLIIEVQKIFTKLDSGFFFTAKELLIKPEKCINEYIMGKREKYIHPFTFLFLMISLYAILFPYVHLQEETSQYPGLVGWFVNGHMQIVFFSIIPFYSFFSYILFINKKYNVAEHLVIYSYILSVAIFILGLCEIINFYFDVDFSLDVYCPLLYLLAAPFLIFRERIWLFTIIKTMLLSVFSIYSYFMLFRFIHHTFFDV